MNKDYLPRYIQIQKYIEKHIDEGTWRQGDLIPTEGELAKQFSVSRITVTTALRNLANDGRIIRIQGKGTYVGTQQKSEAASGGELSGLVDQLLQMTAPGEHRIRKTSVEIPEGEIAGKLNLPFGQRVVVCERVKYSGNSPFALESIYLPEDLFPGVLQKDLENIFMGNLLTEEYNIKVGRHVTKSELINADERLGGILGIRVGAPLLLYTVEVYNDTNRFVTYMKFVCRGDLFQPIIREIQ